MKLYLFSSIRGKISREEKDVEEKSKVFVEKNGHNRRYYNKNVLDIVECTPTCISMVSTNGQLEYFVRKVIEAREVEISLYQEKIEMVQGYIDTLKTEYAGILECRVSGGIYDAVNTLHFEYDGDMISATKESLSSRHPVQIPVHHLVDGALFFEMMEEAPFLSVYHIFANGNATNLALKGYENHIENECVISLEKLKKMHEKVKLEIDCE